MILITLFNQITELHLINSSFSPTVYMLVLCKVYYFYLCKKTLFYTSFHKLEILLVLAVTVSTLLVSQSLSRRNLDT